MNIFRSLIGKVWQDPNAAEVVKISSGQLYLLRPENIRSNRECMYNDAMLAVRRVTGTGMEHQFELAVTRVYEEGEENLFEEEDETDAEKTYLISEEIEFRTGTNEGEPTFIWRDLHGDDNELLEFVAPGTNEPTSAFFQTCVYRAMYERKYRTDANATTDEDLAQFIWHPKSIQPKPTPRKKVTASKAEPTSPIQAAPSAAEPAPQPEPTSVAQVQVIAPSMEAVLSAEAELYLWVEPPSSDEEGYFVNQGIFIAAIGKQENTTYKYWLTASTETGVHLAHPIGPDMNYRFSSKMCTFTWNHVGDDGVPRSWCFKFNEDFYPLFNGTYTQCYWEAVNELDWAKAKAEEQRYIKSSNEDVEMASLSDEEDEEDQVEDELVGEEEEEEEDRKTGRIVQKIPGNDRNSQLTVGYRGDRSYVVRGNNIGVFNSSSGDDVEYYATISKFTTPKGKAFEPKHVLLHEQDSKMVLMNPSDPHSIFNMDLERGKIIEEWKVHDDIQVDHIAPKDKFAPTTHEKTLVGLSHNALFRIDPRMSGNKMVDSEYKQYVSKNKFSGVTTTSSGKLAVASEKGDIRLFDAIGKNAKTALPPLGDPILGIDATADGRYIVATTKTYLLLIDTLIGEGRYAGQLGFDRSFPATSKPIPRRLQVRPEHVAYMGGNVSFTPARFNQGEGQEENAIITSSKEYVIAWDFKKVKKGRLDAYEIKKYEETVVQDNFRYGDDKNIIVALQNNVLAVNKSNLKKPTRQSLAPGGGPSRSGIVNSPY